jgi:predicted 2-oxoglutarate/Fe(II)-dependent dioxygenase YbiX
MDDDPTSICTDGTAELVRASFVFASTKASIAPLTTELRAPHHLHMDLRENILIRKNAIGAADLKILMDHVQRAQKSDSLVSNFEDDVEDGVTEWVVNKKIRDTQEVDLSTAVKARLGSIEDDSIESFINPFYRIEVRDREPTQILHYGLGGHYIPHVDAETLYKDEIGLDLWEKTLDRDLSVVYFLNIDFSGGELVFPSIDLAIKPEAGMLVCFPSDHNYIHGVNPVTSGHRYTIVNWMRVKGMLSMEEINQMTMDEYDRVRPKQIEQGPRLVKGGKSLIRA